MLTYKEVEYDKFRKASVKEICKGRSEMCRY